MKESKADRFRRVSEARVNKTIRMVRLLGNCSRGGTYAYTEDQVEQIFSALQTELDMARERFANPGNTGRQRFSRSDDTASAVLPPQISIKLPDGSTLRATDYPNSDYPSINIEQVTGEDEIVELVCFAEFNPERSTGGKLCIGAYQSHQDDTTYYEPYIAAEGEENAKGITDDQT